VWLGVVVNGEQRTGTAEWADIVYEIDKLNVTDRHLKHVAQDALKVS
jgi:hypothetical protein